MDEDELRDAIVVGAQALHPNPDGEDEATADIVVRALLAAGYRIEVPA